MNTEEITFERMHQRITGTKLSAKKREFDTMESYIEYTIDFFRKYLDLDIKKYLTAPIFDNDKSLLNGNRSYRPALPFSGSHKKMFDYFGKGFSVDTDSVLEWLDTEPQSLYRDVLIYQLSVNKI